MRTRYQVILGEDRKPAFAVISFATFARLDPDAAAAYLSDEELYDQAMAEDDGDPMPHAVLCRILDGDNKLAVYREWRGLSQQALADGVGVSSGYISQIERLGRQPSHKLLARLATALRVDPGDLT